MSSVGTLQPIDTLAGVQPITDMTAVSTKHYTYADKVRFDNGVPEKIGGYVTQNFDYGEVVQGTVRSLYSEAINGKYYYVLGSNEKLYSLIGSRLANITPFQTTDVAIADSLDTHYATLSNNPFTSVNGSPVLKVLDAEADRFVAGDTVYISGATGFAGILAGSINGDAIVRSVGIGFYTINVGTAANASTSGGGNAVVRSSGLITVNDTAHGQLDGDRVKIEDATSTGGILDTKINAEFIIRNVSTDSFDIMTTGDATSSVTGGGGSSTIYYPEIPDGALNEGNVQGYGAGLYGMGLYGTALVSSLSRSYPRIWFDDRYGDTIILTPGNQTGVYQWQGSIEEAPALVPNAPTAINYAFVSNNILVTFGAANLGNSVENRIFASDLNDITNWTSSSTNQVFDDDIEGAGRLTSHVPVEDYNLIFTENKTYTFRYIGLPFVWEIKPLDENIGIIAPMARVSVKGMGFWMGLDNFYMYRGGTVEVIPANSQHECTALNYVFNDINWGQKSKIFAWYNRAFSEVWFHYPSANSNEPNRVVAVNVLDFTWSIHTFDRTAGEYPSVKQRNPRLIDVGTLYMHEFGANANGEPLPWELVSNKRYYGKDNIELTAIIPDSVAETGVTFEAYGYLWPQSVTPTYINALTNVMPTSERIPVASSARFYEYKWSGAVLDQTWIMGTWFEEIQKASRE